METKMIKVNPKQQGLDKIHAAVKIIERGGVVAFPTVTVYGMCVMDRLRKAADRVVQIIKSPSSLIILKSQTYAVSCG